MTDSDPQTPEIPPARFDVLIQLLSSQAILALGLIPDPQGKTEVRLPLERPSEVVHAVSVRVQELHNRQDEIFRQFA